VEIKKRVSTWVRVWHATTMGQKTTFWGKPVKRSAKRVDPEIGDLSPEGRFRRGGSLSIGGENRGRQSEKWIKRRSGRDTPPKLLRGRGGWDIGAEVRFLRRMVEPHWLVVVISCFNKKASGRKGAIPHSPPSSLLQKHRGKACPAGWEGTNTSCHLERDKNHCDRRFN